MSVALTARAPAIVIWSGGKVDDRLLKSLNEAVFVWISFLGFFDEFAPERLAQMIVSVVPRFKKPTVTFTEKKDTLVGQ
jgi:hypothetical protein